MDRKKVGITAGILALMAIAAWAFGFFGGTDPAVAELQKFRDENFPKMDQMTDEQRRAQFTEFRERVDKLSDEERREFFDGSRDFFQARMLERMNHFFDLPPKERKKELDEQIDRMEKWRKEWAANGDQGRGGPGGDRGGRGGPGGDGGKGRLDNSTPEMRAKMDQYRTMMNDRRKERGLEPMEGGRGMWMGGGFRGGGGGRRG